MFLSAWREVELFEYSGVGIRREMAGLGEEEAFSD